MPAPVSEERAAEFTGPGIQAGENQEWGIWEVVRIAVVAMIAIGLLSTLALGLALRFAGPARPAPADLARNARVKMWSWAGTTPGTKCCIAPARRA